MRREKQPWHDQEILEQHCQKQKVEARKGGEDGRLEERKLFGDITITFLDAINTRLLRMRRDGGVVCGGVLGCPVIEAI